jgi:hypothetical protein
MWHLFGRFYLSSAHLWNDCITIMRLCPHIHLFLLPNNVTDFNKMCYRGDKGKDKVVPVLLSEHHDMKAYWGEGWMYSSMHSLTLALDGGEWSASRPGRFIPREGAPGTHWIGGWVDHRAVSDAVVKRKSPSPHWESNPRTLIIQPIAQCYTDWAITALLQRGYTLKIIKALSFWSVWALIKSYLKWNSHQTLSTSSKICHMA